MPRKKNSKAKVTVAEKSQGKSGRASQPSKSAKKASAKRVQKSTVAKSEGDAARRRFWLVKSEPDVFSIDDLARAPRKTTCWDGVRNYQARNTLRDEMQLGDLVLFYHSNAEPPGIAGICKVVRTGYPDHTAFDPQDKHFDPKSDRSSPTWYMVDVQLVQKFARELTLSELKQVKELEGMVLLQRGSRLSVQPVTEEQFRVIEELSKGKS